MKTFFKSASILIMVSLFSLKTNAQIELSSGGSGGNYTVTYPSSLPAYQNGLILTFKANHANIGAATLKINSLAVIFIKKSSDVTLSANDIKAGQSVMVIYNGGIFQMMSQTGNSPTSTLYTGSTAVDIIGSKIKVKYDGITIDTNVSSQLIVKTKGISSLQLGDTSVSTAKVKDLSVTNIKLANNSVDSTKINNGSVGYEDITSLGATNNQVLTYNGIRWAPKTSSALDTNFWRSSGNNFVNNTKYLGSNNNASLRIKTNNIQRMIIDSLGNIGIGTVIPAIGSVSILDKIVYQENDINSGATSQYIFRKGRAGTTVLNGDNFGLISFSGHNGTTFATGAYIVGVVDGIPSGVNMPGKLVFSTGTTAPSPKMILTGLGRLGIGINTPTNLLHVSVGGVRFDTLSGVNTRMVVADKFGVLGTQPIPSAADTNFWRSNGNIGRSAGTNFVGTRDLNDLVFKTNNIEQLRILTSGNVAIGANSSATKFRVNGNALVGNSISSRSLLGLTIDYTSSSIFSANSDMTDVSRTLSIVNEGNTTNSMAHLGFRVNPGGGNNSQILDYKFVNPNDGTSKLVMTFGENASYIDRFVFSSNGRLGINTINPTNQLHVATGGVRFDTLSGVNTRMVVADKFGVLGTQLIPSAADTNFWRSNGNNGVNNTRYLGSINNASLRFRSNNVQRMIIDSLGRVGIGTTSPTRKLQVIGGLRVDSIQMTTGAASGSVLTSDALGNASWQTAASNTTASNGLTKVSNDIRLGGTLTSNTDINQSTNKLTFNYTGGNTGIEMNANSITSGPALNILSNSTLGSTSGTSYLAKIERTGATVGTNHYAIALQVSAITTGASSSNIGAYISASSGGGKNYSIWAVGAVGIGGSIGVSNPRANLDIEPSSLIPVGLNIRPYGAASGQTGNFQLQELLANGTNSVGFKSPDNIATDIIWTLPNIDGTSNQVLSTNGAGLLGWSSLSSGWGLTGNSGTTAASNFIGTTDNKSFAIRTKNIGRVIVDSLGNLGIGINNPTSKLQVNGEVSLGNGSSTGNSYICAYFVNKSGGNVNIGDLVVADYNSDLGFITTTDTENPSILGVAAEVIANGATGKIAVSGVIQVNVVSSINRGEHCVTSGTNKLGTSVLNPSAGASLGIYLSKDTAGKAWVRLK